MSTFKGTLYILTYVVIQILITEVRTNCEHKADVEDKIIPEHYENYRGYIPKKTEHIIKSIFTQCNKVHFPIEINDRESCKSCSTTLEISSIIGERILPSEAFTSIPQYDSLILNNLNLSLISPGAFRQQTFEEIYISENYITGIDIGVFNSLLKLQALDISYNRIEKLQPHILIGAIDLKKLNFSNNELSEFSCDIFDPNLRHIEHVDLSNNKIRHFNCNNITVEKMLLNNNQLKHMDFCPFIFKILDISKNILEVLSKGHCNEYINYTITTLNISSNHISKIDQFYFENGLDLQYLYLNHNNISNISTGVFHNLHNLKQLNLSENNLRQFQYGTFDSLNQLEILDLSSNQLRTTNKAFHILNNLKELYLQNNNLETINVSQMGSTILGKISLFNNHFSCESLLQIVHNINKLRPEIYVINGNTKNSSNILGIGCSDNEDEETLPNEKFDIKSNIENAVTLLLKETHKKSQEEKDVLKDYFNNDFKNSNFYKFMSNFHEANSIKFNETEFFKYFNDDFENSKFYKYLENLENSKNLIDLKKNIYDYFNSEFRSSDFGKYLDDLKNYKSSLNEDFLKSSMYNYFNTDFQKSNFYKYLENLKNSVPIKVQDKPQFEKLTDYQNYEHKIVTILTINTIFVVISCIISLLGSKLFYKMFIKRKITPAEQVELFES